MQKHHPKSAQIDERDSALSATAECAELQAMPGGVVLSSGTACRPQSTNRLLPDKPIDAVISCPEEFTIKAKALQRYGLIISIDFETEQNRTSINRFGQEVPANTVISCQYAATYRHANGTQLYAEGIIYFQNGERISYKKLLHLVCKRFGIGYRTASNLFVLSLAHHGAAEWACYADRDEYLPHITAVRKTPVTFKDMLVSVPFEHGHTAKMHVMWRDSRLLAPGTGALHAVSEVTTYKKKKLSDGWIQRMGWVLAEHRAIFEAYAITDVRVVLEYYLRTIFELEKLTGINVEPVTLGDATVRAYQSWLGQQGFGHDTVFGGRQGVVVDQFGKAKCVREKEPARIFTEPMAAQAFMGGLNIAFETGRRKRQRGYIFLDIDFSGAYPASLAVLYVIAWAAHAKSITIADIRHLYGKAGHKAKAMPIVVAHVKFEFPLGSRHACLPVASGYGLLYPRTGTTTCTGPEIALALEIGAKVEILESAYFPPLLDADMNVVMAFAGYLGQLASERAKHPKGSIGNLLCKELGNSFYGKLAQAVEHRNIRDLRGKSQGLRPSRITCAHYAAMCTGLVRAALACVVHQAEQFPGVTVLSATTDGCMLRIPFDGEIEVNDNGEPIPPHLQAVLPGLYEKLVELYPIRMLIAGRRNLGLPDHGWLESKHVGDEALTIKTRGYVLRWKGKQTFLARCGHKVKDAGELEAIWEDDQIGKLAVESLVSINDIAEGRQVDLVNVTTYRRVNACFDYKRLLNPDGSTSLPESVGQVIQYRTASDTVRRSGRRATPEAVALAIAGVRQHGGTEATIKRQVLRAIAHNHGGWRPKKLRDVDIAEALGISPNELKNAKKRKFLAKTLPPGRLFEKVIKDIAKKLGMRITQQMRDVLLSK